MNNLEVLKRDIEYNLDRQKLYNDAMTPDLFERCANYWLKLIDSAEAEHAADLDQADSKAQVAACDDHDYEIGALKTEVQALRDRITKIGELI